MPIRYICLGVILLVGLSNPADAWPADAPLRVVSCDPMGLELDLGPAAAPAKQIELVGARNGTFSGKVVVMSDRQMGPISAVLGDLVQEGGQGKISRNSVRVRYALPRGVTGIYDALSPVCPTEVDPLTAKEMGRGWMSSAAAIGQALLPVWVTVSVPHDAQAGDYQGKLAIRAGRSQPYSLPVRLHVADWALPAPGDFETFVELIQSPESVAMEYNAPLWSERHFVLIAKSLQLIGQVGNKTTYIPLICQTNQGNSESMVQWVAGGGSYKHDFSVMEKYLDCVEQYSGKPKVVCIYVWDTFLEGGMGTGQPDDGVLRHESEATRQGRAEHAGKGPPVTELAGQAKGKMITLPPYSDPASRKLWAPLLEELSRRLKARGLGEAMALGIVTDVQPTKEVVEFFKDLLPGVAWMRRGHMRIKDVSGEPLLVQFGPSYNNWAYDLKPGQHLSGWRGRDWRYPGMSVHFPRSHRDYFSRCIFRLIGEVNIAGAQRGFGGYGADFWPVVTDKRGRRRGTLSARYPESSWRNLNIQTSLLAPGPDGAVATARFEMMREGLQECEARIFVEKALLDDQQRRKLGQEMVERCWKLLDERIDAIKTGMKGSWAYSGFHWETQRLEYEDYINSPWQQRSGQLFALAGEVEAKLRQGRLAADTERKANDAN